MFIQQLFEGEIKRVIVIYPGRFQPFHLGHKEVFETLQAKFGMDNVYIGTSNKTDAVKSPFNFSDKLQLMTAAGVNNHHVIEVTSPYMPDDYIRTIGFDPKQTVMIFAVGEPDLKRLEVDANYTALTPTGRPSKIPDGKSVGDPKPFKTFRSLQDSTTADQHQYVLIVNEREKAVEVNGKKINASHGTQVRELWNQVRNDPKASAQVLQQLYGRATPELAHLFNKIPDSNAAPAPAPAAAPKLKAVKQPQPAADLNEFAPPGGDDGNDGFSDETLKRLAAQWWQGDEDPRVEKTLAAAGWEIGQDEGYDNGGVFVVQAGDINGNSYISWPAEELEGLGEGAIITKDQLVDIYIKGKGKNNMPIQKKVGAQIPNSKVNAFIAAVADKYGLNPKAFVYGPSNGMSEATGDEKFDKSMRQMTGKITPADADEMFPTQEFEPYDLDPSRVPNEEKYKAKLFPLAYQYWTDGDNADELRKLGWEPEYGDDYVMVVLYGIGHDGHIQYDKYDFDAEGNDSVNEDAAGVGVVASKKQKNDPRYSMSLTKDVRPGEVARNMKKLHLEGNRGYNHGFASPTAPSLGRRGREDDEYHVPDPAPSTWYIRANGKIIKDKMGTPFQFRDKEAAHKSAMTMMAKPFNAGKKFVLTTRPEDEQGVAEAKHFRTTYGWAGGRNEKTGKTYKHPDQIKADKEEKRKEKELELEKNKQQTVAEDAGPVTHRIGVTVIDPNHPMVSKRKEAIQKSIRITQTSRIDREAAINQAIAHYRRKGYKVLDHHYMGTVDATVAEGAELKQAKRKYNQAAKDANLDQVGAGKKIDTMKKSLRQKDLDNKKEIEEGATGAKPGWMLRQDPALAKKVKDSKAGHQALKKWAGKPVPKDDKQDVAEATGDQKFDTMMNKMTTGAMDREFTLVTELGKLGQRIVQNPKLWARYQEENDSGDPDWIISLIMDGTGATFEEVSHLSDLFGEIGGGMGRIIDFAWSVKEGHWEEDFLNPYRQHRSQGVAESMFDIDDKIKGQIQNITTEISDIPGYWDHQRDTFTPYGVEALEKALGNNKKYVKYALSLTSDDYYVDESGLGLDYKRNRFKSLNMRENTEELNIGDPVIITGDVQFKGKTGDIDSFGDMKRFVVVNLYNYGRHSFHSSDVSSNEYVDPNEIDEDMYQYNKEDPYNSEFAPRAGMGRMTLRGWKQQMIKRTAELAQQMSDAGQDIDKAAIWDHVYKKLKSMNMDPIAQEIEQAQAELEKIRQRGGVRSRAFNK